MSAGGRTHLPTPNRLCGIPEPSTGRATHLLRGCGGPDLGKSGPSVLAAPLPLCREERGGLQRPSPSPKHPLTHPPLPSTSNSGLASASPRSFKNKD